MLLGGSDQIMQLEIQTTWRTDIDPPESGLPADPLDFEVGVQVSIGEIGSPGGEVFSLSVCSVSALSEIESGRFVTCTLILERFDWDIIRVRIGKLLRHCESSQEWTDVISTLSPFMRHDDAA